MILKFNQKENNFKICLLYELQLFKEETTFTQYIILKIVFNKDEQETIKKCLDISEVKEYVTLSQQIAKDHSLMYDEKQ